MAASGRRFYIDVQIVRVDSSSTEADQRAGYSSLMYLKASSRKVKGVGMPNGLLSAVDMVNGVTPAFAARPIRRSITHVASKHA